MPDAIRRVSTRGNSLLIAMVVLLAFAMLVLAGSHFLLGEQRISANQNDRQFAFQLAELALRDGEKSIDLFDREQIIQKKSKAQLFDGATALFTTSCTNTAITSWPKGLCATAVRAGSGQNVAWERVVTGQSISMLHPCGNNREYVYESNAGKCSGSGTVTAGKRVWSNPRYIVELIDRDSSKGNRTGRLYRITARAWGRNKNTQVMLQSYFFIPIPTDSPFV